MTTDSPPGTGLEQEGLEFGHFPELLVNSNTIDVFNSRFAHRYVM